MPLLDKAVFGAAGYSLSHPRQTLSLMRGLGKTALQRSAPKQAAANATRTSLSRATKKKVVAKKNAQSAGSPPNEPPSSTAPLSSEPPKKPGIDSLLSESASPVTKTPRKIGLAKKVAIAGGSALAAASIIDGASNGAGNGTAPAPAGDGTLSVLPANKDGTAGKKSPAAKGITATGKSGNYLNDVRSRGLYMIEHAETTAQLDAGTSLLKFAANPTGNKAAVPYDPTKDITKARIKTTGDLISKIASGTVDASRVAEQLGITPESFPGLDLFDANGAMDAGYFSRIMSLNQGKPLSNLPALLAKLQERATASAQIAAPAIGTQQGASSPNPNLFAL